MNYREILAKLWPAWTGLAVLIVYLLTGARTYSWMNFGNDGADLAAAIATGGIPHPPGFPLYLLLGKVVTLVLPLPDFIWRLNVLSAVGGAVAVTLMALACYQLTKSRLASAVGALVYGFAFLPWGQATITEVSTWLAAFSAGCLYCLCRARESSEQRWMVAAWLCCGLATAVHPIGLVCVPTILWFMWLYKVFPNRPVFYLSSAAALLAPLTLYALPYFRSSNSPAYIWAYVDSLRDVWWYTSFQEYWGTASFGNPMYYIRGLGKFLVQVFENLGILGTVLGTLGLFSAARIDRKTLRFVVGTIIAFALPVIIHNENPVLGGYYALSLLPFALLVALGCRELLSLAVTIPRTRRSFSLGWLALAAPAVLLLSNWSKVDAHADTRFTEMMERVELYVQPNALIVTMGGGANELDETSFGLAYGFLVHAPRPDVNVVVNISGPAEIAMLQRRLPQYDWSELRAVASAADNDPAAGEHIGRFVQANRHLGPIYFSFGNRPGSDSVIQVGQLELHALPNGLLYEVR